ncbi:outer membrane transport energization protein TonB [Xenorhabdus cabanillasii]|uniref:Protein TonB n=2 Tax=Xenorhabdus cabanillasii TaxID=351673 RepID=A0A3D9UF43_9GAMM|nr:outer membrane transport energization protein TonB [Xenorhabdus cabanillasii]
MAILKLTIMLLIKNFLMRWIHWPVLLSVCLHIFIAVALFGSIKSGESPEVPPMSVAMIQLAAEEVPVSEAATPESISEPEPEPEPIAKIALPKPKPEKKPKEKKIAKKEFKPKEIKTEKTSEEPVKPITDQEPLLAKNLNDQKPTDSAIRDIPKAQNGPKALNRMDPVYPSRAQQLGTEGTVRVKYDIDENGRVKNIEIISADPKNVFEREVKKAMRKWRYEKKPATGYMTTIEFKLTGVSLS